jgi:hypothetical protein
MMTAKISPQMMVLRRLLRIAAMSQTLPVPAPVWSV